MRFRQIVVSSAVAFGFLLTGATVSAAADRPNTAFINEPNVPFDSVIRSLRLTDKIPTTVLVELADARDLTTNGVVLAVNVGDPDITDNRRPTHDLKRTTVAFPLGAVQAQKEIWQLGKWESRAPAKATAVGSDTVELDMPDDVDIAARTIWITRRAPDSDDDVAVSPLYSLNNLASADDGFGASSIAWNEHDGHVDGVSTDPGPRLTSTPTSIQLTFGADPPTNVGDQKVAQVLDVVQIRPNGESGVAPFRLEIDEMKGTMTGYAGTSSTALTYTPPGTAVPRDQRAASQGTRVPAPVTYTTTIGKVAAGTRLEIPVSNIELGIGTSLTDGAGAAVTRRVVLANGDSIFFDGVSTPIRQAVLRPTGSLPVLSATAPVPGPQVSRKTQAGLALAALVVLLVAGGFVWWWARDTDYYRRRFVSRGRGRDSG